MFIDAKFWRPNDLFSDLFIFFQFNPLFFKFLFYKELINPLYLKKN